MCNGDPLPPNDDNWMEITDIVLSHSTCGVRKENLHVKEKERERERENHLPAPDWITVWSGLCQVFVQVVCSWSGCGLTAVLSACLRFPCALHSVVASASYSSPFGVPANLKTSQSE